MADDIRLVLSVDDRDLLRARKEQEKYQYRIAQIEKEFRKGTITASRYNKELANQARELAKLGGGYNKANSEIRKYAYSLRNATDDQLNLAQAMAKSGKGMRRMEILAQQAGYQIGDFAVQVQSGTNAAVAFGQQASQLLGFFGPYGAIAGAGIAIGTGLIAPLLNAKKAAKEAKEELSELDKAIKELRTGAAEAVGGDTRLEQARKPAQDLIDEITILEVEIETLQRTLGTAARNRIIARQKEVAEKKAELEVESEIFRVKAATIKRLEEDAKKRKEAKKWEEGSEDRMLKLAKSRFDAGMALIEQKKKEREAAEEIEALSSTELKKLQDQNALLQMQLQFGKDSAAFKQLETDIAVENYEAELLRKGVAEDTAKQLADQYRLSLNLKKELQEMSNITFNFAPTTAVAKAMEKYAGRGTVSTKDPIFGDSGKSIYDKGKKPTTIEDTIKAFQRQIETEKTLMTLTGQRRREEELFLELKYANQDADIKTSETRLRGLAQEMAAMEERSRLIEEARQQQEDIADMIGSSFESAMMSIVDGTKSVEDAFKTMAAEVIKELYRVLVVQQMVNAAKSYFGFADGGVISKGNVVPYANGGIVGSPTYFPMAGGRTGLMGEAGPEAIMPLKRGKNGKLGVQVDGGQQQSVVVNQSFNFQANGDDSVKRIIAQQAPKIAQMTQQQIMDSRRRGGQMKAVFG
jgi:chromosome segregation ATPase